MAPLKGVRVVEFAAIGPGPYVRHDLFSIGKLYRRLVETTYKGSI